MEQVLIRSGIEAHMGIMLHRAFTDAGLPAPTMCVESQAGGPQDPSGVVSAIAQTYLPVSMASAIERHGIATAADAQIESWPDRMLAEVEAHRRLNSRRPTGPQSAPSPAR